MEEDQDDRESGTALTRQEVFDPFAPGFFDDPYPQYRRLRNSNPVDRSNGGIRCFRYNDVQRLLRNTEMTMGATNLPGPEGMRRPESPLFPRGLLNLDPPDHPRVRRFMLGIFTPRKIDRISDWIEKEVATVLDGVERSWRESREPVDLVERLSFPLPFRVISDIIGMPESQQSDVRNWAQAITEATATGGAALPRAIQCYKELSEYVLSEVIPWKKANLSDDLLSAMLEANQGGTLTGQEVVDQVALLYVAGHETTSGLIGNGVLNLLRHRRELERLQANPELMGNALEELNRFESPIQFTWRYPLEGVVVGSETVDAGDMILLCLGSANRDPEHFGEDAETLDIRRENARDLVSFGAGAHFCLGAALARCEGALAIGGLLNRFSDVELAGEPVWNPRITFRGLKKLPVAFGD